MASEPVGMASLNTVVKCDALLAVVVFTSREGSSLRFEKE